MYLEIAKGESTPTEGVSLREGQSRAVKCSVVGGEPVDQVRGYDHDRVMSQSPGPGTLPLLPPPMSSVSQAIRAHNAALTNLYFHHRETVHHIQSTLRTQILPNVLDELALGDSVSAHDWAQEWLNDERKFVLGSVVLQKKKCLIAFFF